MNPVAEMMDLDGEDYEVRRAGQPPRTVRGLSEDAKRHVVFLPGTDVQVGDELENMVTNNRHVVTEINRTSFAGKMSSVDASYAIKHVPHRAGHTIHIGSAVGSPIMVDSPGALQSVTFTSNQTVDLRKVLGQLLQDVDGLEIEPEAKAELKHDAEYLDKKLEAGKAKPGFVRECLDGIKSQLATAASKAAASGVASKVGKCAQMVQDFYATHFGGN